MKKYITKFNIFLSIVLLVSISFSILKVVNAVTPNPGHPWVETGDGVFAVTGPTTLRTFTFPDLDATVIVGGHTFTGDVTATLDTDGSTVLTFGADRVLESHLKAVDSPADEECLTYEATVGDFEWQSCGVGGSGDSLFINASAATDLNFLDVAATGTVTGSTWTLDSGPSPDTVTLSISNASDTQAGSVTTGTQTFAGDKTFTGVVFTDTLTLTGTGTLNGLDAIDATTETTLEAALDLQDLQGAVTDAQVPNNITVDLATAATALAANPTDCSANQFATAIAANGNLTCAAITDADVPNSITIDLATLASTVTVVDSTDATSFIAMFDDATGSLAPKTDGGLLYNASTGTLTATAFSGSFSGNSTTATALAANGANCSAGSGAGGVSASGVAEDCTDYEEDLLNSAGLLGALSDETGTGLAVFNDSPTFADDITLSTAGVLLSGDGDGAITFLGLGNGSDEDFTINLDDTTNTIVLSSSTGVTLWDFGTIDISTDTLTLTGTGTLNGLDAIDATTETTLEAALDLQDLQGAVTDAQVPNNITIDLATLATTVTVSDAGGDTTTFPLLGIDATGSLGPRTDAGLTYNATTANLTATTFTGALSGNSTTATALAANGANCSAGSAPLGVDSSGAAESCTDFEEDLLNSAGLLAALNDETGTGLAVFNNSPTFVDDITLSTGGVLITGDGDGALTFLGLGDGSDEDFTINLDDTTNTIVLSSSTGVTLWDFGTIDISTDTITLTGTGTLNGLDAIDSTTETTLEAAIDIAGDISGTGLTAVVIGADKVLESHLKAVDSPADEECLTYEATGGDFEWQSCGGMSIGGTITSATEGSVLFAGASGVLAQDNSHFFWDDTANSLGIGTLAPEALLEVQGVEGADATIALDADEGDDATDTWFIKALATGNSLSFVNNATEVAALSTGGALQLDSLISGGTQCLQADSSGLITGTGTTCGSGGGGMNSLTLAGTSGSNQTLNDGDTITIAGGAAITTTGVATDTVIIAVTAGAIGNTELAFDTGQHLTTSSDVTFNSVSTPTLTLTGTGTLNGLDAIDATTETTLESYLDLAGDISSTGLGSTVIGNDKILESMLKAVDSAADEECLTYEATGGDFEWQSCGGMSIGGTITSATEGSVLFAGASGVLAQDNSHFFWDDSSNRLGLGTNSPSSQLDITGTNSTDNISITTLNSHATYSGARNDGGFNINTGILSSPIVSSAMSLSSNQRVTGILSTPTFSGSTDDFFNTVSVVGIQAIPSFDGAIGGDSDSALVYGIRGSVSSNLGTTGFTEKYGANLFAFGTADTNYGLFVEAGDATTNYAIYSQAGLNYFADNVGIASSAPSTLLQLGPIGTDPGDTGVLSFLELDANGSNYVGFKAPDDISSDVVWTLPDADAAGCLQSDGSGTLVIDTCGSGGQVDSVVGTANRITVNSTDPVNPVVDIASTYVGQNSITTLGTITTGVWNGTAIANANLANSSITIGSTGISLGGTATTLAGLTSVTSTTFVGALTGNASTATALAANPTDCSSNQFATAIAANGNLTCASITDADVPNDITIDLATLASTITVVDSTDATSFIAMFDSATGNLAIKTDGGLLYDASNGTLTSTALVSPTISLGTAGVQLTGDGDGALTFLGLGDGSDEDFTINLDDTTNTIVLSSSTGVTLWDFGTIDISTDTITLTGTGTLNGLDAIDATTETTLESYLDLAGDISSTGLGSTVIGNDKILESMLKAVDSPADEECLTYEATGGDFEWQACDLAAGDITSIGDVTSGAAFDGTSGTTLTFDDADGDKTFRFDTTNNNFEVNAPLAIGSAGVKFSDDGDGAITFLGLGNGSDEDFTINLDDTTNTITLSSSTGVTLFDFGTIDISTDTITLTGTGTLNGLDAIDATTESTLEAALDLPDLQGVLSMAKGGTNKNMTAIDTAIAYSDSDSLELNANLTWNSSTGRFATIGDASVSNASMIFGSNPSNSTLYLTRDDGSDLFFTLREFTGARSFNIRTTPGTNYTALYFSDQVSGRQPSFEFLDATSSTSPQLRFTAHDGSSGTTAFQILRNANSIFPNGSVGIGSSSPEALLEIQGAESTDAVLALDADDGDDNADTWFIKSEATGNDLSILNHTTEVFNLTSAGDLTALLSFSTPTVNLTGTGTLNGLDAIDATGETTLEAALDLAGDISSTGLGSTVIGNDKILESMLKAVDSPADEECLTYEATGGDFEWQSCAGVPTTITVADTTDSSTFVALFEDATGDLGPKTDAGLTYNATTANLTATTFTGALSGNSTTATALAANGANCSAGSAPLGVDASGAAESCTDFEEDLLNSAGLLAALNDETGTGLAVFNNSPTFVDDITLSTGGVLITGDGDGALTFLGLGDGSDEDFTINLDDTTNTIVLSSSTGVTLWDFGTIDISTDTITLTGTGTLNGLDAIDATTETTLESYLDLAGDISSTGLGSTVIGNDKILESMLKAVDSPADEECLTYEATGGDFEWQACGGGGGDSITINSSAATDANFKDVAASGSVAGITWSLDTDASPDDITLAISNASATVAGVVTTGTQTFAGAKTFTSDVSVTKTDPSIILDTASATDTDFWLSVTEDAGGDDDDFFQIGDGTTPGTNAFFSINTTGQVAVGSTFNYKGKFNVAGTVTSSGADAVAGIFSDLTLSNSTSSGTQFGHRFLNTVSGGTAGTEVGTLIRMTDSTVLSNTVRGLEVQAWSGTNTAGTNTGIAGFGKTFGLTGTTDALAGGVSAPAAIFADLDNGSAPTVGNAIRAYSDNATSADLVSIFHETSTYTGNGLLMNLANNAGGFTGNFLDLQKAGTSKLSIDDTGEVIVKIADADNTIALYINTEESTASQSVFSIDSDSTGNSQSADTAKFHIEADGSLFASLTGTQNTVALCHANTGQANNDEIVDCSGAPSDIAEWYETESGVEPGDVVAVSSGRVEFNYALSIGEMITGDGSVYDEVPLGSAARKMSILAKADGTKTALGIVSTAPYQTFGEDVLTSALNPQRIALTGRVPVKVTDENGLVIAGDRLTPSATRPGYAMKMLESGQSLGVALEDANEADDKVLVFVSLGYQHMDLAYDEESENLDILFDKDLDMSGFGILNVKSIMSSTGKWSIDSKGTLTVQKIKSKYIEVDGVTIRDRVTGKPHCIFFENGQMLNSSGACDAQTANTIIDAGGTPPAGAGGGESTEGNEGGEQTPGAGESDPEEGSGETVAPDDAGENTSSSNETSTDEGGGESTGGENSGSETGGEPTP